MYTAAAASDPAVGPHLFFCHGCERGTDETPCACRWTVCDCEVCRQTLRKERYAVSEFRHDIVRGMHVVGCVGKSRPPAEGTAPVEKDPEIEKQDVEILSAEPVPPAALPVPPAPEKVAAPFRALLRLCGLSHAEAAVVLGQSESSIKKKSSGTLATTSADRIALRTVWNRICSGDLGGLQPGSVEAAAALQLLQD